MVLYLNVNNRQSAAKEVIMANRMSIEEYIEKINMCFPEWEYKVLEFSGMKDSAKIKCLKCGQIYELKKAEDLFRKVNACKCFKYFKDYHEKVKYLCELNDFTILAEDAKNKKFTIQCNNCQTIMVRDRVSILKTPEHCDNCNKYREGKLHYSSKEVQNKLDEHFSGEYELIKYNGMHKMGVLKHLNCGFVFNITCIGDIFNGRNRGCPKCYQFKSKGEQAIMHFLEENNIRYIPQKTFVPLNKSKYRFDFFLPDFNIAIEYQGEQHYKETNWFHDELSATQKRDEVKRNYCIENNIELLEIPYWDYNKISQILTSRFNDYLIESRDKRSEMDTTI